MKRAAGLLSAILMVSCATVLAQAGSGKKVEVELPAQPMDQALKSLAQQTGAQLLFRTDTGAKKVEAPALQGAFTLEEALRTLLAGSGLVFEFLDANTVSIMTAASVPGAANESTIETVNVFGTLENQLSIGSKSGQSLRETPKSVTLVTRERIEAQNLSTLADALNQATGVTLISYSPVTPWYFSRGFRINSVQLDGGAPAYTGNFGFEWTPDMAVFDHVEVLRGVDGMFTGAGEPGGIVNVVRKRAQGDMALQFNASTGRWDNNRAEVDLTGPLAMDGRLRGRVVAAYEDRGYFLDRANTNKAIFFGTTEFDLTPSTLLIAGGSYESRDEDAYNGWRGLPRYFDGTDPKLARSTNLAPDWNYWDFRTKEFFARAEQQYGNGGVIKLNLTRLEQTSETRAMFAWGTVDASVLFGTPSQSQGIGDAADYQSQQNLIDLSASGKFSLFGRDHTYTVGTDYAKIDGAGQKVYQLDGYVYPNGPAVDVFNFDPSSYPEPNAVLSGVYPQNGQKQKGFYATVGLQLTEPLRLIVGARYSEFSFEQTLVPVAADGSLGASAPTRYDDHALIPSVAVTYEINPDWSAYASYAETFKAQASLLKAPLPGTPLDPITGGGYELGIKGEILGFLNAAAAIYRVDRSGEGVQDPTYPSTPGSNGSSCCYVDTADVTSEGFDAELSGTVLPGWQLFAGYTYNQTDAKSGQAGPVYFLGMTPRHMVKLWTTWQLPGEYSRLTLNAGVTAQSETYIKSWYDSSRRYMEGDYALLNAAVQYRLTENVTVGLYGENLLDKSYYQVLGNEFSENFYGVPRSYVLTMRANW